MTHISSKFKHFSEPRPSFKMMGGVNINEGKLQAEEGQGRKRYCDPCRKYFTNHASLQRHVKEGVHKEPKISVQRAWMWNYLALSNQTKKAHDKQT